MPKVLSLTELKDDDNFPVLKRVFFTLLGLPLMLFSKRGGDFELSHYRLELAKLKQPLRLLQLSDLHFNVYLSQEKVKDWFDVATAQAVDLIVITGDFYDYLHWSSDDFLLDQLKRLNAPLGVWAVWGNHDYDKSTAYRELFRTKLEQIGIRLLVNEGVNLRDDLYLAGLDDVREGAPDLDASFLHYDGERCCLFLSHVPDVLPLLPDFVDLTLCGHTHGGQIVLPLLGVTQTSSYYGKTFAAGWIDEPVKAYVARGLGFSTLPIRLNCPGEITVITLETEQPQMAQVKPVMK
ncbi:MAG: metallophosphoesterase [Trueperaceae bacterium]|nr:metallophosphoesterase [Trueperaceae bacterium]